ncbi:Hypothetical protein NTJ_00352 [Nesidiocoris tenuis]|uniref:Uncharacterized protein n=1 Tax=Nesidiocoris tenuis TaxID=355587 RepID=A0ABN7ABC2_9HEMI|nr:Hypothetical protein NTJ_00352 [Nesidiocoris tenuis]
MRKRAYRRYARPWRQAVWLPQTRSPSRIDCQARSVLFYRTRFQIRGSRPLSVPDNDRKAIIGIGNHFIELENGLVGRAFEARNIDNNWFALLPKVPIYASYLVIDLPSDFPHLRTPH